MTGLLLWATVAGATEIGTSRDFGLGIQLGGPSGLTGKVYLGDGRRNAIDFTVGGGYYGEDLWWNAFWGQVAYHWNLETLDSGGGVTIPFRIGVGGFVTTGYYSWAGGTNGAILGARVPFGVDFDFEDAPFQLYIEAAFDLTVLPPLSPGVDGGIGGRYYF
ncbi:MAG: hypothetical protein ABMA64_23430 [Myxococcota bacterium]